MIANIEIARKAKMQSENSADDVTVIRCALDGRVPPEGQFVFLPCGHAYCFLCIKDIVVTAAIIGRKAKCKACGGEVPSEHSHVQILDGMTTGKRRTMMYGEHEMPRTGTLGAEFQNMMIQTASPIMPGAPVPSYVRQLKMRLGETAKRVVKSEKSYVPREGAGRPYRFIFPHQNEDQEDEVVAQFEVDVRARGQTVGMTAEPAGHSFGAAGYVQEQQKKSRMTMPGYSRVAQEQEPLITKNYFEFRQDEERQGQSWSQHTISGFPGTGAPLPTSDFLKSRHDLRPQSSQREMTPEFFKTPLPPLYPRVQSDLQHVSSPIAAPQAISPKRPPFLAQHELPQPQPHHILRSTAPHMPVAQDYQTDGENYQPAALRIDPVIAQMSNAPIPRLQGLKTIQTMEPQSPGPFGYIDSREPFDYSLRLREPQRGGMIQQLAGVQEPAPFPAPPTRNISLLAGLRFCFKGQLENKDEMENAVKNGGGVVTGGGYKHTTFGVVGPGYKVPDTWAKNGVQVMSVADFWSFMATKGVERPGPSSAN